ncbi:MAG: cyclase family protein [Nitrospirae bacterium]|nr:cyclase family protein [Nitrospirota bacterium]
MPVYGSHNVTLELVQLKVIEKGDSCQVFKLEFENHWGTHIDCPAHFFLDGKKVTDYPPEFWHFKSPQLISVQLEQGQILTNLYEINNNTDLLLIQTGWSKFRGTDIYSTKNPGLSPELGLLLRNNYPNLRAIGLDLISISSYTNRDLGRAAHQAFLDPNGIGHPILLIEDMLLPLDINSYKEIIALPLIVEEIDSSPCTIISL